MEGGKFKRKLSEVNTRAMSRRKNELVGKFKMAADDIKDMHIIHQDVSGFSCT